jgi:hypothetical protein
VQDQRTTELFVDQPLPNPAARIAPMKDDAGGVRSLRHHSRYPDLVGYMGFGCEYGEDFRERGAMRASGDSDYDLVICHLAL